MPLLPNAERWRARFPIFQRKTYLNSCSQGALSTEVRTAYETYLTDWEERGSPWELWVERNEATRAACARLLNAHPDEIALTTSVSAAVSALASSLDYSGRRNKIVVSDFEFPTVAQIWHAQERRGARIVHVPVQGNTIPYAAFEQAIDDETLLVAVSHISYRTGARQDAAALTELTHRHGALLLLDSYQAVGTLPIDAQALGVDFLVGGNLKYLLASAGLAFLYVRRELIPDLVPTALGWFAQENIFAMDIYQNQPATTARRFESGTPAVPSLYAGMAGLNLILEIGTESIASHIHTLTDQILDGARQLGCMVVTPQAAQQRGALVALRSHDVDALVGRLAERGIIVSSRDHNLRISPHFYNTPGDIERLLEGLRAERELLVSA